MPIREDCYRTCRLCGREFFGAFHAKYCQECRTVTCPVCGKEFSLTPSELTRYVKRGWITCSRECGQRRRRKLAKEKGE